MRVDSSERLPVPDGARLGDHPEASNEPDAATPATSGSQLPV